MLRRIEENYQFPNEGEVIIGKSMGCGCCSHDVPLTVLELDNHISDLQKALEVAHKIRELVEELEYAKNEVDFQDKIDSIRKRMLEFAS
jgi:hypothetical protein